MNPAQRHVSPLPEAGFRGRRFARRLYLPRVLGLGLGFFCVAGVFWQQSTPLWQWALLLFNGFVWPHVAYQIALRAGQPYRAEFRNLMVDSLFGGFWLPLMQFNVVPSVLIIVMLNLDNIATGGLRFLWRGLLANLVGALLALLLVGFHWQPQSNMTVVLTCIPFLIAFPLAIGLITYRLANQLGQQKKQLEALSRTDGLTGLFNRSHWQNCLDAEFVRSRRLSTPVALLMVDLDHFKNINDRFGHAAGDEVLRRAADLLRSNLRCVDVVGRYGGEEFAVILPHTHGAAAQLVAERLRRALAELELPGIDCRCTLSVGVAPLLPDMSNVEAWLARADAALYAAKQQGRDRVVLSGES